MKEENRLYLKVPTYDELWYRKYLLSDPKTMEYNKGYDIDDESYNYDNGTYDFDERYWDEWYNKWAINSNQKFYAYLMRKYDNKPIGEIAFDITGDKSDMNLLIEASARGFHYSKDALDLITQEAFEKKNINVLSDYIAESKVQALDVYKNYGFKIDVTPQRIKKYGCEEKILELSYSKDEYLNSNKNNKKKKNIFGFFFGI